MKKIILTVGLVCSTIVAKAQNVYIPDANFKNLLLSLNFINTNMDGEISEAEALAFSGSLDCSASNISSLEGIQYFNNLTGLNCSNNNLSDLSMLVLNTNLVTLGCAGNQLTSLDVSSNGDLVNLYCNNNLLTSLNVANGNNINFESFSAIANPDLTCIQVDDVDYAAANWTGGNFQYNASLSEDCLNFCTVNIPNAIFKNYLVTNTLINTNNDSEIQCHEAEIFDGTINCSFLNINDLTGIEAFTNLKFLYFSSNQLQNLDLSQNTQLEVIVGGNNQLGSLDLNSNPNLTAVVLMDNELYSLNLANGHNSLITGLNLSNNPLLTCIQVDNAVYSTSNWTTEDFSIPSGCVYSEDCSNVVEPAPAAPTNLNAIASTSELSVALTWTDNASNELGFFVQRSTNGTDFTTLTPLVDANNATYTDNTVVANTQYFYRVAAYTLNHDSDFSNIVSVTTATLGLENLNLTTFEVYPNPAQDILNVSFKQASSKNVIQIFDAFGRELEQKITTLNGSDFSIDVSNLAKGSYWISVNLSTPKLFNKL
jgi:hypothetical protein